MKHYFFKLQSLAPVALLAILAMSFMSCSNKDNEPSNPNDDNLTSIVVGVWSPDDSNDIYVVNSNGTGVIYGSPALYEQRDGDPFTWTYEDGQIRAYINGRLVDQLRAESVSQNKIVWKKYNSDGSYKLWTWERYKGNEPSNPTEDNLTAIVVGAWSQDGDNDIYVVNSNGTGMLYNSPALYEQKKDGYPFTWTYQDGCVRAYVDGELEDELRPQSVDTNKIIWKKYSDAPHGDNYYQDNYGYYKLWTWERYAN